VARFNAAHLIKDLIDEFPELAKQLIDPMIDSLELDDDIYNGISADWAVCQTLAAICARHPDFTQEKLDAGYKRLSADAKNELVGVYRCIVIDRDDDPKFESCVPRIISPLVNIVGGLSHDLDVRDSAAETLETISDRYCPLLIVHLDSLLGAVANLTHECVLLGDKAVKNDLDFLQKRGDQAVYTKTLGQVSKALKNVCRLQPRLILARLREIVPKLDSAQPHLAAYKAELAALYGELGRNPELLPEIIPELYKLLLDFDSVFVRGSAIQAITRILEKSPDILPENMVGMIIVYLLDTYVYIHKSAARAARYLEPVAREERIEIARRLVALDEHYVADPYFRKEILQSLVNITYDDEVLLRNLTAPVLVKQSGIREFFVANDALEQFERLLSKFPAAFETVFAREVISFLGKYARDRFNNEAYSDRYLLLLRLFTLSSDAIKANLTGLQEAAIARAKTDPLDALRNVQLLSYFGMHEEAADLADKIEAAQDKVKQNEFIIRECQILSKISLAEYLIGSGKIAEAIECLEKASKLEEELSERNATGDGRNTFDTFRLAQEIADDFE
jgi:hypothetical protein